MFTFINIVASSTILGSRMAPLQKFGRQILQSRGSRQDGLQFSYCTALVHSYNHAISQHYPHTFEYTPAARVVHYLLNRTSVFYPQANVHAHKYICTCNVVGFTLYVVQPQYRPARDHPTPQQAFTQ